MYENRPMDYEAQQKRRRENLRAVIQPSKRGAIAEFARTHDIDPTLLSQLLKGRPFTERQARDIEAKAKLPTGSLDGMPAGSVPEPGSLDEIVDVFDRADWMAEETKTYLLGIIKVMHDKNEPPKN